ncbi:MAG TPA: aldehyde dehydrogenase family protein [Trebonia sp.]|nr:aldehyde dehydrogenase family protein [Trebonia sp.]
MEQTQLFAGGEWRDGDSAVVLPDKYTGKPVAEIHYPSRAQTDAALAALADAQARIRWPPYDRYQALARASELLHERAEEAVRTVVTDSGFTVQDARREVDRAVQTLLLCGEEAKRLAGEMVPIDGAPGIRDRLAFTVYHPLGVVCAITPFNSPLNTVLHKVGPALAAGNAVLLKPASQTPLTAALVIRLLLDAGVPAELMSLLNGDGRTVGQWLLESQVPAFYAFTGSTEVGKHIHAAIGLRRAQLEMGSISSTIVCDDADLDRCLPLCVNAGFRKAGQVCTSVQRLYVHETVTADVLAGLTSLLRGKKAGDPSDPETFVGPLVSPAEAERVESWARAAAGQGAEVVTGGHRDSAVVDPTVLAGVTPDMTVMCREIFGPVMVIRGFSDLGQAIGEINDTPYGLAAGIFTKSLDRALTAAQQLRMGSVHINETSSSRVDMMPYTGVKASGLGKEGPWWAIREMSEERLITMQRA